MSEICTESFEAETNTVLLRFLDWTLVRNLAATVFTFQLPLPHVDNDQPDIDLPSRGNAAQEDLELVIFLDRWMGCQYTEGEFQNCNKFLLSILFLGNKFSHTKEIGMNHLLRHTFSLYIYSLTTIFKGLPEFIPFSRSCQNDLGQWRSCWS